MAEHPSPAAAGTAVTVSALRHRYADQLVLDGIDFHLEAGQVLALLGPSGCGKTTLLKLLAGLLPLAAGHGSIDFGARRVAGDGRFLPPEARGLGMVFQDYALWPHMTVGGNVAFALEMRGLPRRQCAPRVAEALAVVGLQGYEQRNPSSLSGGQQQRVALARAIAARPQVLLFDEPLSNLDRDLRDSLCHDIGALLRAMGTTAVYVTHDQEEAFALADRVAVMRGGRIRQLAAPAELLGEPADSGIAEFLQLGTLLPADAVPAAWHGQGLAPRCDQTAQRLLIPPSALTLRAGGGGLPGEVLGQRYRNGRYHTAVRAAGAPAGLTLLTDQPLRPGQAIELGFDWQRLRWLPHAA
jgi:iron(III) transport system ATP-binding protein